VIFDLDDTLIVEIAEAAFAAAASESGVPNPTALAETARRIAAEMWRASPHLAMGQELGIASWEAMWADFTGGHPRLEEVRAWAPTYRLEVWRAALADAGGDVAKAAELSDAYIRFQRAGHPEIAGATDLVRRLRAAGHRLAILTNGPPDIQRLKLEQLGLSELFETEVISGVAGVGKPDPAIFEVVLAGLSTAAKDTVMIGDSWNRDIEGAESVGMRSIWISNGREPRRPVDGLSVVTTTPEAGGLLGC